MALTKIPAGLLDKSAHVDFADNERVRFGAGSDLQIYHNGSNASIILDNNNGSDLLIQSNNIVLEKPDGENMIHCAGDGAVQLYHNGSTKLATASGGVNVTGNLGVTGDLNITGNVNSASVTDLDVTDKTITVGAGQVESASGGSGIIVGGSSASILWDEAKTAFDINSNLEVSTDTVMSFSSDTDNTITFGSSGTNKPCIRFDTANTTHTNRVWAIENGAGDRLNFFRNGLDVMNLKQDGSVIIPGGNVGVGTSSPAFENGNGLEIRNSSGNGAHLKLTDNASGTGASQGFDLYMFNSQGYIENYENAPIIFRQNGGESARFSAAGNFGIGNPGTFGDTSADDLNIGNNSGSHGLTIHSAVAATSSIFFGNDGTNGNTDGSIQYHHESFGTVALRRSIEFKTGRVSRMVINSAGKVGIGTTDPAYQLHVKGAGHQRIKIEKTDAGGDADISLACRSDGTGWVLFTDAQAGANSGVIKYVHNGDYMSFRTNGVDDRMRINSAGNVGIGAVSNTARLRVEQSVNGEWAATIKHAGSNVNYGLSVDTSAGGVNAVGAFQIYAPSSKGLIFTNAGKMGLGHSISAPETELHVKGSNNSAGDLYTEVGPGNIPSITIQNAGTTNNNNAALYFRDDQDMRGGINMRFTNHSTHASELRFATTTANNTREKFVMTAAGQFGINKMASFDAGGFGTPMMVIKQLVDSEWGGINVEANGNDGILSLSMNDSGATINTSYRTGAGHKPLTIKCAGQDGIQIGTGGHVRVGSGNVASNGATHQLHVDSGSEGYGIKIHSTHGYGLQGSNNSAYYHHTTDRGLYYFDKASYASGGFHTYSDSRLKENVTTVTGALDSVALMNGVTFTWDNSEKVRGPDGKQFGVLAQNMLEVDSALPTLNVDPLESQDNIDDAGKDTDYYTMDYSRLTPYFIEAIKELKTKLEAAEARIATLEG